MSHFLHRIKSPNFGNLIFPEFIIIHYTGGSFERVKELMEEPDKVSAHFVIDLDGNIDNVIDYNHDSCYRAWHAGKSKWIEENGKLWEDFNSHSIGIEIVNLNGNIQPYNNKQMESLINLCKHIFELYPNISNPNRILGHEQIAGFRGKADPGRQFKWDSLFTELFPAAQYPNRDYVCPEELAETYKKFLKCSIDEKQDKHIHHSFWHAINASMEKTVELLYKTKTIIS